MAVPVGLREGIDSGAPVVLFDLLGEMTSTGLLTGSVFDVSADGQRFYVALPRAATSSQALTVMTNFPVSRTP